METEFLYFIYLSMLSSGSGAGTELEPRRRCKAAAPQLIRAGPLFRSVSAILITNLLNLVIKVQTDRLVDSLYLLQ